MDDIEFKDKCPYCHGTNTFVTEYSDDFQANDKIRTSQTKSIVRCMDCDHDWWKTVELVWVVK